MTRKEGNMGLDLSIQGHQIIEEEKSPWHGSMAKDSFTWPRCIG